MSFGRRWRNRPYADNFDSMQGRDARRLPRPSEEEEREGEARRTAALMGFALILALAVAAILLVRELDKKGKLEDCLMSGRKNCAPIEAPFWTPP